MSTKISELPSVVAANLLETDSAPFVVAGVTSKVSVRDLRAKFDISSSFNVKHPSFGAVGDGVTNDTAAFTACDAAAALVGGVMVIPPSASGYKVSGFVQTCKRVIGAGVSGKLVTTSNASVYSFGADDLVAQDVAIQGNATGGAQNGFTLINRSKCSLLNPRCDAMGGAGIYATQTLGAFYFGNRVVNPTVYGSLIGIQADTRAEYLQVMGGHLSENTTGIWDVAGNVTFIGTHVLHNTDGYRIDAGTNDSHGCAIGCKINHNTQYEVRINGISNGFVFSACHIFENAIWLKNCVGVQFLGGELSVTNFYFEGSTGTLIADNVIDPTYGNTIQNDFNATPSHTQWRNNRRLNGTFPTFLENINGCYISGTATAGTIANAASGTVVFGGLSQKASNNNAQTKYALYDAALNRFKNWGLGGNKVRVQLFIKCSYVGATPLNVYADIGYYVNGAGARLIAASYLPIQQYPALTLMFIRFEGFLDLDANSTFDVVITNNSGGILTIVNSETYVRIEGL